MKFNAGRLLISGLFLVVVASMECSAQQVSSFEQLQLLVKPGDNIYVTDSSGQTTKGRIAELSPSSLGLVVKGVRRNLSQIDVREIRQWRGDSLKNGTLIGAAVGGGIAALGLASGCRYDGCSAGEVFGVFTLSTGLGAAIGVGIDALIPAKQMIFWNPNRTSGKLQIQPILDRSNKGVKVAWSF
jgi:hypothetical protein